MTAGSVNPALNITIGAGIAAFMFWRGLKGLMTGRVSGGRQRYDFSPNQFFDRDIEPIMFWYTVIFYFAFGAIVAALAMLSVGWIKDPVPALEAVYREIVWRLRG